MPVSVNAPHPGARRGPPALAGRGQMLCKGHRLWSNTCHWRAPQPPSDPLASPLVPQEDVNRLFLASSSRAQVAPGWVARVRLEMQTGTAERVRREKERHSTWCQARCVSLWEPESPTWALTSLLGQLVRAHFMSVQLHKAASLLSKAVECLRKSKLDNPTHSSEVLEEILLNGLKPSTFWQQTARSNAGELLPRELGTLVALRTWLLLHLEIVSTSLPCP